MAICKFYQQGNCRNGDACRFEHPGARSTGGTFGGGSNNNRFGGFSGDRYRPNQPTTQPSGTFGSSPKPLPYHLDKADMKNDLTGQRPIYPLSCYGPGRDAPRQLIEGPVEISPEELRVRYYTQRFAGNEPVAQQEESALNEKMQQQVQSILNDIDGAIRYIEEGANVHPNRIDIAIGNAASNASTAVSSGPFSSSSSPFSQAPATSTSQPAANPFLKAPTATFGQSSTPGFGQPAFGQPSNPAQTTAAFGRPSNPGQAAPGFGAASSLGPKPSPFGQPSALGGGAAFGKPAFGASGFGQPSMPGAGSTLGAANALQKPAFGQASAPGTAAPFGQPSAVGQQANAFSKPAFGQSGFGQAAPLGPSNTSPFGQAAQSGASPFGQQPAPQASPFGQQAQEVKGGIFGSNQSKQASSPSLGSNLGNPAGGQPNPFQTATSSQPSPFGQQSQAASNVSPFGTQPAQPSSTPVNPFLQKAQAQAAAPGISPFGAQNAQPASPFAQASAQPQASSIGQQAASPAAPGAAREIDPKDRFKEGKPEEYEGEQGRILEEIYRRVGQLGRFNDDEEIPLVPPKCEWIVQIPLL